jgi:hypothetical protein
MPCNEKTTRRPDGSKTVRKEHIDPSTGKCVKIEITEYPSTQPDFSVMSNINKKVKTTVIYPEDDQDVDTGFHSTLYNPVGKTTVGETKVTMVPSTEVPRPTATPLKVEVPTIAKPPVPSPPEPPATVADSAASTHVVSNKAAPPPPPEAVLESGQPQPVATSAERGCCVIQ